MRYRQLLFLLPLLLPIFFSFPHSAFAAPAIDGSAYAAASYGQSSTSTTLTTTQTNDVIIIEALVGGYTIASVSDTAGLSWQRRDQYINSGNGIDMEEWYAVASSPLSGDTITVTSSGAGDETFEAFGVSGANTATPFAATASPVGTTAHSLSISTYEPSMIISFGDSYAAGTCTAASGYTLINGNNQTLEYITETGPVLGLSLSLGSCAGTTDTWIADAIAPAGAVPFYIDGHANGNGGTSPPSLTTSDSNDIIVLDVANEDYGGGVTTVSSVSDTAGLMWHLRSATSSPAITIIGGGDGPVDSEVWWAYAPSPLTSDVITPTFSGSYDCSAYVAFGVNGANTTSPWDPNGSLPTYGVGVSGGTPTASGLSTSESNTMFLGFVGSGDYGDDQSGTPFPAGSGYTVIDTGLDPYCAFAATAEPEYKVVSSTQSGVSAAFGATAPSGWFMTGDAIQAASTGGGPTGRIIRLVGGIRLIGGVRLGGSSPIAASGGGGGSSVTFTATAAPTPVNYGFSTPVATFSGVNIGTPASNRIVVVGLYDTQEEFGGHFEGNVQINGIYATLATTTNNDADIWYANVPTSTTATITSSGYEYGYYGELGIQVGTLTGANPLPYSAGSLSYGYYTQPQSVTATVPTNGVGVVFAYEGNTAAIPSWTNATGDSYSNDTPNSAQVILAHTYAAGSQTPTITSGNGNSYSYASTVMAMSTWQPGSLPTPLLDGSAANGGTTGTNTVALTTNDSNDIIVLHAFNETTAPSSVVTVSSVSDTAGLTWHLRSATSSPDLEYNNGSVGSGDNEVWWALAPSPLTNDVITATFSSGGYECDSLIAFGVNGANTSSPWDSNGSLPAAVTSVAGGSAPSVSGISTTHSSDMLVGFMGYTGRGENAGGSPFDYGPAYTFANQEITSGGWCSSADQYLNVSSTQSSITNTYRDDLNTTASGWMMTADAIQ